MITCHSYVASFEFSVYMKKVIFQMYVDQGMQVA